MDERVRHDATLRTLSAELCDRGYGRAEGRREAGGRPKGGRTRPEPAACEGKLMRRSCCPGA